MGSRIDPWSLSEYFSTAITSFEVNVENPFEALTYPGVIKLQDMGGNTDQRPKIVPNAKSDPSPESYVSHTVQEGNRTLARIFQIQLFIYSVQSIEGLY